MQKLKFSTVIYAPKEKVWRVLWDQDTYPVWTEAFSEGSRVETDWEEGSRVLFVNQDNEGMVSRIAKKIDNEYISFEHLGMVDKDGNEDLESDMIKGWIGAQENYRLKEDDGKTELQVEIDVEDSHTDHFSDSFPRALQKIKELSEDKFV